MTPCITGENNMTEIKTDKPIQKSGWTVEENVKENEDIKTTENETETGEELIQLGECRKHPATPVPIISKDGKKQIGAEMFGGIKSMIVYEFPQCTGEECSSDWCNEHQCCINICRHDHGEYYQLTENQNKKE